MTQKQSIEKYKEYLTGHIGNVAKALEVLATLDIPYVTEHIDELREIVKEHDASKYEEPEWSAYLHHFYPTNDEEAMMEEEFENACKHHIRANKHHWNYWCDEDNNLIEDIDEEEYKLYTIERICDWLSMAAQHDEGPTEYWNANKDYIVQPEYARELCDEIFPKIPEDFGKDMWKITRGELDESIKDELTRINEKYKNVLRFPIETYKYRRYSDDKTSKYLKTYQATLIPQVTIYAHSLEELDKLIELYIKDNLNEDLYMNRDVVDNLGKRVKRSKTSNTIEIDTSMTNHDRQLKEENRIPKKYSKYVKCMYLAGDGTYMIELKDNYETDYGTTYIQGSNKKEAVEELELFIEAQERLAESVLNEMKLSQIKQKSKNQDPERINRSRKVKSTYLGMSKFGILNFKTTSQSRNGHHYQTIEFKNMKPFEDIVKAGKEIMPMDVKKQLQEQDVNVWCTDESFAFWAWAHQAYKNDFLYMDDRIPNLKKAIQAPKVNNVRLNGGACKHILSVIDYVMKPFVLLAISEDMNKFLAGNKEDKFSKQSVATQNQYDMVAQWDWSDIEEITGKSKIEIMSDISKTLQIIPDTDKGDIITDIVGEVLPQEEQGIKRQIVDKIEDLIDNEDEGGNKNE